MTHILHRHTATVPPVAVHAKGITITDSRGKEYIDASGGAAVSCLGHGHPAVLEAMHQQIDRVAYAHTGFFTTEVAEELADHLTQHAPEGMDYVYLVSGGSEAVEAALKIARQYFLEIGQPERKHFIARQQSYHGNTLGALAVGGNQWRKEPFSPILMKSELVSACYEYRNRSIHETPEQYSERLANELEETILRMGPETVIAFVAETVVGATAGALCPTPGYFKKIRDICTRYGILLILDEVMCGMGRTGTLHACEQEGITPDLMTIAKGLGGGYQPIGATLMQDKIYEAIKTGSGYFQHGHTYLGHPTACAAALAVQKTIQSENLLQQVQQRGQTLKNSLTEAFASHPYVGDIRGRGLFQAIELVNIKATKLPFDPTLKLNARIKKEAMERGLMVYPMGGTIDGKRGDHVLLAPPFIASEADIELIVDRLKKAVDAAIASTGLSITASNAAETGRTL